ncbi:MAG: hypothetical protein ACXIVL_08740 [Oceanicaulis sp.]
MTRHTAGTRLTGILLAGLCFAAAAWMFHAGPRKSGALFVSIEPSVIAQR